MAARLLLAARTESDRRKLVQRGTEHFAGTWVHLLRDPTASLRWRHLGCLGCSSRFQPVVAFSPVHSRTSRHAVTTTRAALFEAPRSASVKMLWLCELGGSQCADHGHPHAI